MQVKKEYSLKFHRQVKLLCIITGLYSKFNRINMIMNMMFDNEENRGLLIRKQASLSLIHQNESNVNYTISCL